MSSEIRNLEPKALWNKFADLNEVPRPSKKEERVIEFMMNFGKKLGLETIKDDTGNVIIKKPASKGYENRKTIVMQSHLDMVHQKNNDTNFDFSTQGIDMYVKDGWVRAKGTTLGADNGLGVATIMAILESKEIEHPAIEALFTIDEETGMTGALGLKGGLLSGDFLLNLDTEEDDELTIGCAGGLDVTAKRNYKEESVPDNYKAFTITVKGLNGGHSGMDIHRGLGNANKMMNRLLYSSYEKFGVRVSEINGGSLRNAIPRESVAVVVVPADNSNKWKEEFEKRKSELKFEFKTTEKNLTIELAETSLPSKVMEAEAQKSLLKSIYTAHNGVYRMSADIPNLVETSNNVARVLVKDGEITILCLTRSSVESSKYDLADALKSAFELCGCEVTFAGAYPGWTPNVESPLLEMMIKLYEKQNGQKPKVAACHAGLECGILGRNYPGMDMISFGPTIKGAHSPDERANIASAEKYWNYVLEILKNIPKK
ncbi:MAG TPA: aminoacyl-histidine dipeptidase [Bacteroidia bacterium]|nr:aminoacyl-histidine dipeptidase [Bacteroidia bacterium]